MDYTVHGILQARTLEWAAFPFCRGSSHPRDGTWGLLHCRRILYQRFAFLLTLERDPWSLLPSSIHASPETFECMLMNKYSQAPTLEKAWCWQLGIRDGPARAPQHLEAGNTQGGLLEEVMPKLSLGIVRLRAWT